MLDGVFAPDATAAARFHKATELAQVRIEAVKARVCWRVAAETIQPMT